MGLFRVIRILALLILLGVVAFYTKSQKLGARSWITPLEVVIFPINGAASPSVERYIDGLTANDFADIDRFMAREGGRYRIIAKTPTLTTLGPKLDAKPPPAPSPDATLLGVVWWGLRFRAWAWLNTEDSESGAHRVRVFVLYHDAAPGKRLQHSLGLPEGLLGVVHAFAAEAQNAQNNIVIAHEVLHTVGARDKYDAHGEPIFPEGYADPAQALPHPQRRAEIMAGRIALSATQSRMADSLNDVVVGEVTAREISWIREKE